MNGKEITQYAVDSLLKNGIEKAQCLLTQTKKHELNIEANKISLMRTTFNANLSFKAIKNSKQSTISSNKMDITSIDNTIKKVVELADAGETDAAYDIAEKQSLREFEVGENLPDLDKIYQRIKSFLQFAGSKWPHTLIENAYLTFNHNDSHLLNSNGVDFKVSKGLYDFVAMFTSKEGKKTSSFNYTSFSCRNLEEELIEGGSLARLLEESSQQLELKSINDKFVGEIIITPDCLNDFLYYLINSLSDMALISGTSVYKDKIEREIARPIFSLHSMPRSVEIADNSFLTPDGYEMQNYTIIEKGILKTFLLSQYGAKKTGLTRVSNVGNALVIDSGTQSLEEIIKTTKRGLVLCRFSGGRPSDGGEFSGVAKNSYYIEDGEVRFPVSETMVSGNFVQMFKDISAISSQRVNFGNSILPWIRTSGITVSGK